MAYQRPGHKHRFIRNPQTKNDEIRWWVCADETCGIHWSRSVSFWIRSLVTIPHLVGSVESPPGGIFRVRFVAPSELRDPTDAQIAAWAGINHLVKKEGI